MVSGLVRHRPAAASSNICLTIADRHFEGFSSLFTLHRIALELGDLHYVTAIDDPIADLNLANHLEQRHAVGSHLIRQDRRHYRDGLGAIVLFSAFARQIR